LVDAGTNHQLVVVNRQQALNDLAQHEEAFLFIHDLDEAANNQVESLAVADYLIAY